MSGQFSDSEANNVSAKLPPPSGDPKKADHYIVQLVKLIKSDKLTITQTDLAKFDPSSLQNHYRLDLKDYQVEVSHSKQPDSGKDFYIILFNNLNRISDQCTEKIILAYIHLSNDQFKIFKAAADDQLERRRKEGEEKRFKEAMTPIDQALEQLTDPDIHPTENKKDDVLNNHTPPVFI